MQQRAIERAEEPRHALHVEDVDELIGRAVGGGAERLIGELHQRRLVVGDWIMRSSSACCRRSADVCSSLARVCRIRARWIACCTSIVSRPRWRRHEFRQIVYAIGNFRSGEFNRVWIHDGHSTHGDI